MTVNAQTIFQWINTAILVIVLVKLLKPMVAKLLQSRADKIRRMVEQSKIEAKNAAELKLEFQNKLSRIQQEEKGLLDEARRKAAQREAEAVASAKQDAADIVERAKADSVQERENAKDEMRVRIIEIATKVAEQYVEQKLTQKKQAELIDSAIDGLGGAKWQ
ncbi:MAG: ATP synthase F0 subunit B [Clostridiales bacterium]|jgi:F-type H+-transporting ATPase subunit b|nr:ATP synthase F0 subunit B [Clostridiales bacterium]